MTILSTVIYRSYLSSAVSMNVHNQASPKTNISNSNTGVGNIFIFLIV